MTAADIRVSLSLDWLGRLVGEQTAAWKALGRLETALLAGDLDDIAIETPVYVCGLARAGSTILLETLAGRPGVATHRYQDFPFLFTPYWWSLLLKLTPGRRVRQTERAHGDRILITPESPEAMEEMLWMAFFPFLHKAKQSEILDGKTERPGFARFYRDHIKKLLLVRKAERYVSKGNYNVTRMAYIRSLFPNARFIIPVRKPESHIASLMRQHERFNAAGANDARVARHLAYTGHFEFGPGRMPIHTGDDTLTRSIESAWKRGEEARGWALLWDAVYRFVHRQLEADPALKSQAMIVRYEDLCADPKAVLGKMFAHTGLPIDDSALTALAAGITAPDYYDAKYSEKDAAAIREITRKTAALFGY